MARSLFTGACFSGLMLISSQALSQLTSNDNRLILEGTYTGNSKFNQRIRIELVVSRDELKGSYVDEEAGAQTVLSGWLVSDAIIELSELQNGNIYSRMTLRRSSAQSFSGNWQVVGENQPYSMTLHVILGRSNRSTEQSAPSLTRTAATGTEPVRLPGGAT